MHSPKFVRPLAILNLSLRSTVRSPASAIFAVLTLALGFGANLTVFSAMNQTLFARLPVAEPETLLTLTEAEKGSPTRPYGASVPGLKEWSVILRPVADVAAILPTEFVIGGAGSPTRELVAMVTETFFSVARAQPFVGRSFTHDEYAKPGIALVSHRFWTERLGASRDLAALRLTLGGHPLAVIGVLPPGFDLPRGSSFFVPFDPYAPPHWATNRRVHVIQVLARVKPGAQPGAVSAALDAAIASHAAEDPGHVALVRSLRDTLVGDLKQPMIAQQVAALGLLLIACFNVAGLLMARAQARSGEWALHRALGARPAAIAALVIGEGLVVSALGLIAGVAVAMALSRALSPLLSDPRLAAIQLQGEAVAVGALMCLVCGVASGLLPARAALRASGLGLVSASTSIATARVAGGRSARRWRGGLVAAEVAATFALLGGSLLLIASLESVRAIDPGFAPESLLTLRVAPPPEKYDARTDMVGFFARAEERIRALPGVQAVGGASVLPLGSISGRGIVSIDGASIEAPPEAGFLRVTEGYFDAIRLPLVAGRRFTAADDGTGEFVTIVNESLAKRLWPNGGAIGQRIKVGPPANEPWLRIVGVIRDHRQDALDADAGFMTFEPVAQRPRSVLRFAVRASGDASRLAPSVHEALRGLEPLVIVDQVATMDDRIEASLKPRRLQTWLWGAFAALATLVAAAGVYGVAAWAVRSRRREFGIRMALGAAPRRIATEAAWSGVEPVIAGLALGLPLAIATGRSLGALLYGVSGTDSSILTGAGLLVGLVAALAALPPALVAASVAPSAAIREE